MEKVRDTTKMITVVATKQRDGDVRDLTIIQFILNRKHIFIFYYAQTFHNLMSQASTHVAVAMGNLIS